MQEINLEASANEANEHFYYKKLRKELHDKKIEKQKALEKSANTNHDPSKANDTTKSFLDSPYFKDKLDLSRTEIQELQEEELKKTKKKKQTDQLTEDFKYNAHDIMRHLAHKINFFERKDELIEMYKYNLQQSRSHNLFTARFATFKVGIVGQLLTAIGVPINEIQKLQTDSLKDLFEQNTVEMQENIYHAELAEIIKGKNRKTKSQLNLFSQLQKHLITQMNNIGRIGFWSQTRLYEEKITQCQIIKQEFEEEKSHLEYLLHFNDQKREAS
jgi:predicted site-specific integrase-resolvase